MACFLVPAAEAVIVTVAARAMEKKEKAQERKAVRLADGNPESVSKIPFSRKLKWLRNLLWGGGALLAFEHVWHGEVVPWFPFLTAAGDPSEAAEMLHEMATVGVTMAGVVTLVWLGMLGVAALMERRAQQELPAEG